MARRLLGIAESLKIRELPDAKDLAEWAENGGTREALLALFEATPVFTGAALEAHAVIGVLASEITPEKVSWLWPGRIPVGKVTLIDGDPCLGKSCISTDLAARISRGCSMPDEDLCTSEPAGVVICSCEDGFADTVVPRLIAAGADLTRIRLIDSVRDSLSGEDRLLTLPADIPLIETAINSVGAKLVIVDPLMAFFGKQTDSKIDQDVRRALAPLARMAERLGVAVIVIRHLNKGTSANPLYRGGGSIGIIGAARMAFLVAKDPEDDSRCVVACSKSNLGPPPSSLSYQIKEAENGAARVEWAGQSRHNAASLLALQQDGSGEGGSLQETIGFLRDTLDTGPKLAKKLLREASDVGISEKTLRRAKNQLGIHPFKQGFDGPWAWSLQPQPPQGGQEGNEDGRK